MGQKTLVNDNVIYNKKRIFNIYLQNETNTWKEKEN